MVDPWGWRQHYALWMNPMDLQRFVDAQNLVWADVQAQLRQAHKRTHWMWFVFPQFAGLGSSGTARFYGIRDADEARAYLAHQSSGHVCWNAVTSC